MIEATKGRRNEVRDRCLLLLMFRHGLRVSEACGIKLDQVDTESRVLHVRPFRHRGLKRLYENDDPRELNPEHADKIARMLARLDEATRPEQLDLPGFRLHPLKGDLAGYWSITVRANWRIIFRFEQGDATDVDLVDYH